MSFVQIEYGPPKHYPSATTNNTPFFQYYSYRVFQHYSHHTSHDNTSFQPSTLTIKVNFLRVEYGLSAAIKNALPRYLADMPVTEYVIAAPPPSLPISPCTWLNSWKHSHTCPDRACYCTCRSCCINTIVGSFYCCHRCYFP